MSVTVKRPVLVKVVVTEDYKASRCAEMRTALARLDVVGKQISARLESGADGALKDRLRAESSRNDAARTAPTARPRVQVSLRQGSSAHCPGHAPALACRKQRRQRARRTIP